MGTKQIFRTSGDKLPWPPGFAAGPIITHLSVDGVEYEIHAERRHVHQLHFARFAFLHPGAEHCLEVLTGSRENQAMCSEFPAKDKSRVSLLEKLNLGAT